MWYFILGVLAPITMNLTHMVLGIFVTLQLGNIISLGFSATGFLTKTIGMLFLTWFGVGYFGLNVKIFVPLLTFFWFVTHVVEGFVIKHYMEKNVPEYLQKLQIK